MYVLSKHRSAFAEHVEPLWPTLDRLEAVHDRELLLEAADRANVPVPQTTPLDEVEEWDAERIVKARYAILTNDYVADVPAGRCRHPSKTMYLEPGERPDVDGIVEEMGHVPVAQTYLDGTEYCLRALYRDGEPVATSQKRLVRGYKYPRGPSIYHEAVDIPRLRELGLALLSELKWEGVASVGFIRDGSGTFRLLEVNPRFWSNVSMDVYAGVDYPAYFWRLAGGETDLSEPPYESGVASHLLRGEVAHLYSVAFEEYPMVERPSLARTIGEMATSLVRHPRFDLLSARDPGPFARDLLNVAGTTLPPLPISVSLDSSAGDDSDDSGDDGTADSSAQDYETTETEDGTLPVDATTDRTAAEEYSSDSG